jgi:hypothetical protein
MFWRKASQLLFRSDAVNYSAEWMGKGFLCSEVIVQGCEV